MYTLVRRFIKTGIGFLALGLSLGAFMLIRREFWGVWPGPYLVSAHSHAMLSGFGLFLILALVMYATRRVDWGSAHLGLTREAEA